MIPTLSAQQLVFNVGRKNVIDNLSVTLKQGELIALIGPNGAGKSTLLRLLTGYLSPQSGQCQLEERPLTEWPTQALARRRAVMRQQHSLAFSIPVRDLITMARAPWGKQHEQTIVEEVMSLTACDKLANKDYRTLSGGEQQRVQLAKALAQLWQPDGPEGWLFLDEPTSALDLYFQQHCLRLLSQLAHKGKLAVCVVLHDLNLASLWADRLLLLHQGRLVASGTPNTVITQAALTQWYHAELTVIQHPTGRPQISLCR